MIRLNENSELKKRILMSSKRMMDDIYCYPKAFELGGNWPGDWEGRDILSLCSLYECEDDEKVKKELLEQLHDLFIHVKEKTNKYFYFGDELDLNSVNEQQLAGNSWFIRGLIQYYKITKNNEVLHELLIIKDSFILKLVNAYNDYPLCEREDGSVGGHLSIKAFNHWLLSSDVGCAFILLDGITDLYDLTNDENLVPIIVNIIKKFESIDFVKLQCQTHATLTFTRGLLRFYKHTKDKKYLTFAIYIFNQYIKFGMTEEFTNFNWFKRKDTWTETCGVVDSLIVATQLFEYTQNYKYLELANKIYVNGFRGAQRSNGGAGCNTCLSDENDILKIHLYEAYFCCTMRFGEGLKFIKEHLVIKNGNNYYVLFFGNFEYKDNDVNFTFSGNPYKKESIDIKVNSINNKSINLYIYQPESDNDSCAFKIIQNLRVKTYTFYIPLFLKHETNYFYGDMLLTKKENDIELDNENGFEIDGQIYTYVTNFIDEISKENEMKIVQEV